MSNKARVLVGSSVAAAGVLAAAGMSLARRHPVGNRNVPQPATPVELNRYLGLWYEIARYEQRFELGCEGVTATYSQRADGKIDVVNRCRKPDGQIRQSRGIAKLVDPVSNAKLKVSFFWPVYGDYWVLDHAEYYSWSIVGEPSGRYLWILAREATPSAKEFGQLVRRARAMGYDTSMLLRTVQP
ncbi:MAG TPA: lipocalin family protein [Sphingomicrobium sp.]|nr:lipocalin family protein [Sphingomicrobium sp.]